MDIVFPIIPGWDVAGTVVAVGPDTPEFAIGDEVMAYARKDTVHGGTFAEQVAVPVWSVARKPAALTWEQAGGLPLAGGTALRTLDVLAAGKDDTILVHAAAGGVGSLAVQIAVARGARVIGTASAANHEFLRDLGAEPVAYGEGLAERVRALAPEGVDAVADFVGGQLDTTLAVLAPGGRHASIADGSVGEHGGHVVWVRPLGSETARLAELADEGRLSVEVARTFGLEQVGEAFALSRQGHTRGKIVIVP
jgi:NADPH:quinone reductase-like Zn-dependent oxidoreductase